MVLLLVIWLGEGIIELALEGGGSLLMVVVGCLIFLVKFGSLNHFESLFGILAS